MERPRRQVQRRLQMFVLTGFLQYDKMMPLNHMPVLMSRSIAAASQAVLVLFLLTASPLVERGMQYRVAV